MRNAFIKQLTFCCLASLLVVGGATVAGAEEAAGTLSGSLMRAGGQGVGTAINETVSGSSMGAAATKGGVAATKSAAGDAVGAGQAEGGLVGTAKGAAGVGAGAAADDVGGGGTMGSAASKGSAAAMNKALSAATGVPVATPPIPAIPGTATAVPAPGAASSD